MQKLFEGLLPLVLRVILPSVLATLGTTAAAINLQLFNAFCGL